MASNYNECIDLFAIMDSFLLKKKKKKKHGKYQIQLHRLNLEFKKVTWTPPQSPDTDPLCKPSKMQQNVDEPYRIGSHFTITKGLIKGFNKKVTLTGPDNITDHFIKPGEKETDNYYNVVIEDRDPSLFEPRIKTYSGSFVATARLTGVVLCNDNFRNKVKEKKIKEIIPKEIIPEPEKSKKKPKSLFPKSGVDLTIEGFGEITTLIF